jgi:hypothetical protein
VTNAVAIDLLAVFKEDDVSHFFTRNYTRYVIKKYEV